MKENITKKIKWHPNPIIDITLIIPLIEIPTKQEKFKPLFRNIYLKKNIDKNKQFENFIRQKLDSEREKDWPLKEQIEVFVQVTAKKSRYKTVDIDNLLKSIFDCLNGIVYKDDSQIIQVVARKLIGDDIPTGNSLVIAIRKVKDSRDLKFTDFELGVFIEEEI
jgi:Holliday junction resolvase RusA-like endonuclease